MGKDVSKEWEKKWTSLAGLEKKFDDHGKYMGYANQQQYQNGAQNHINNSNNKSFVSPINGQTYVFSPITKRLAIIAPNGRIMNFYELTGGMRGWERLLEIHDIF